MTNPDQTKSNNWQPNRPHEYRLYQLWKNLPPILRNPKIWEEEATSEEIKELSEIKTQKQFAEKYDLDTTTLTQWNNKPVPPEYQVDYRSWAKELNANVMAILYKHIRQDGDAARIKLWLQSNADLTEKHEHNIGNELLDTIRAIAEKNANGET